MVASRLANHRAEAHSDVPEQELFAEAYRVLRAARLTTLIPQTRADAVSIIEGIRPAVRRSYAL